MKKSKIFEREKSSNCFITNEDIHLSSSITMPSLRNAIVPKKAKFIQLIATVTKRKESLNIKWGGSATEGIGLISRDFSDSELPVREKYCHILWW